MSRTSARTVLFVDASPFMGGAARSLLDLLAAMPGTAVRPVLAAAVNELCAAARSAGVATVRLAFPPPSRSLLPWRALPSLAGVLAARRELSNLAERHHAHLIHSNSTWAHLIAGDVLGLPSIWHCRDLTRLAMASSRLADTATAVIATSQGVAGHLTAQGIPAELVRVIHNGVVVGGLPAEADRPAVRAELRARWGVPAQAPLLAWAGEFSPWKRTEDFLAALVVLRRTRPDVRGVVLGTARAEGTEGRQAELESLASRLGIGAEVAFPGWVQDVPRCLTAADLLVLTSENEPFGRILVEAMAAGLPVVARNGGGVAEVVGKEAGVIIEAPSPRDFAAAAERLLSDPNGAAAMGRAGVRRARDMFSPRLAAERVGQLYEEIAP
ncbi:MAG TPA: glycosyltransferase family 4 protein [Planctomycetota bacterium]|nr:glycosyltransferase family 4 protein [Planctomycetota bacterium]